MPGILILSLLWSQRGTQLHAWGRSHGGEQRQLPCPAEQGMHGHLPPLPRHQGGSCAFMGGGGNKSPQAGARSVVVTVAMAVSVPSLFDLH